MRQLIHNRGFWLLMLGQNISILGDVLYTVATLSFAFSATRSVLGTSSLMIVATLVRLVSGFVTVQVLDRVPHRYLMIFADLVRGAAIGLLGFYSLHRDLGMTALYAVTVVNAFAGSFFTPARAAVLPAVVPKEHLVEANGLIASTTQVVQTAAWAVGAALVGLLGAPALILLNAVSFLISAGTAALLSPTEEQQGPSTPQSPMERLRAGWNEVWSNRVVRDVTLMDGIELFANTIWTSSFMLAFTVEVLKLDERWWGYQGSAYFVGTIMGGLVAAVAARALSRSGGWTIAVSSGSYALLTAWYALTRNAVVAVILCVVFGPVYQVRDVVQSSMLQHSLDSRLIGRAFATRDMLLYALFGPAMAAMSLLADRWGPESAYLTGAALYAVVAVFAARSVPIRTYRMAAASHLGG